MFTYCWNIIGDIISFQPFFTDRVFQIFDKDNSGTISLQEFLDAMHQFAGKSPDDKIKFLFKVYDIDGDVTLNIKRNFYQKNKVLTIIIEIIESKLLWNLLFVKRWRINTTSWIGTRDESLYGRKWYTI